MTEQTESRIPYPLREIAADPSVLWASSHPQASSQLDYYRLLRTRLLQHPIQHKSLVVTSACPADGKSTVCINLAGAMAQRNSRVLLIDADLRKSRLGSLLGVKTLLGLTSIIEGAEPEEAIFSVSTLPNLSILLAGAVVGNAVEVLDTEKFVALMRRLRNEFDYIVIDSPPILHLADFPILEQVADASAFVVRPGYTNRTAMADSLHTLRPEKFTGVVINQNIDWWLWKSTSYYGYYGYYGNSGANQNAV
jgi:polysaccharide biosynthesis transport protein